LIVYLMLCTTLLYYCLVNECVSRRVCGFKGVNPIEVFPGSCTSLARAHCPHTITTIFEALYLDRNTSARAGQWLILVAVASSIGLFTQVSSKSRGRLIALLVLNLGCSGTVSTSGSITTTTGSWGCFCLGGLPLGLLFEAEDSV